MSIFSERLFLLRSENNLSQKSCAKEIQISSRSYANYESCEREPQLSVAARIADFYSVSLDYLAGRTDTP